MTENVFINTKNRSHTITAEVTDPEGRRQRRDPVPGRPLRRLEPVRQGWQADVHLQLPRPAVPTRSPRPKPLPDGKATIRYEFAYDGGGLGKGGTGTIFVNGEKVAEGRIDRTQAIRLLGRRRRGRRPGRRDARDRRLQGRRQQVHRQDPQGDGRVEVTPRRVICVASLTVIALAAGFLVFRSSGHAVADLDALRAQAEQDLQAGRFDRVAAAIERLSRQSRPSPLDYLLRAQYAAARQQPDAALADLKQVPDDHSRPRKLGCWPVRSSCAATAFAALRSGFRERFGSIQGSFRRTAS